jgi:hypothetical protein
MLHDDGDKLITACSWLYSHCELTAAARSRCSPGCMPGCMHGCLPGCLPGCMHGCMSGCMPALRCPYLPSLCHQLNAHHSHHVTISHACISQRGIWRQQPAPSGSMSSSHTGRQQVSTGGLMTSAPVAQNSGTLCSACCMPPRQHAACYFMHAVQIMAMCDHPMTEACAWHSLGLKSQCNPHLRSARCQGSLKFSSRTRPSSGGQLSCAASCTMCVNAGTRAVSKASMWHLIREPPAALLQGVLLCCLMRGPKNWCRMHNWLLLARIYQPGHHSQAQAAQDATCGFVVAAEDTSRQCICYAALSVSGLAALAVLPLLQRVPYP